jgi:beta-phosphoglucomutase-like phosphatase (HAD superfamily)
MFTAAIFDMDGLLIDSERPIMAAWMAAAQEIGIEISTEQYLAVVGRASPDSKAILSVLLGGLDRFERTLSRVRMLLMIGAEPAFFHLKPGAVALLNSLRERGVPCAVASSSGRAEIMHRLESVEILDRFSAIAGGNEVARAKPDPSLYLLAASRLGVDPSACIAFEDSENGTMAALNAGMHVVVVPDLKAPSAPVLARSFLTFGSLGEALAYVPAWFP